VNDLFADKAADWDTHPLPRQLSEGIGAAIAARVPLSPSQTLLDFGAGTGLLTERIAPQVSGVIAVDVSSAMLAQLAAKPVLQGRVETVCQDLLDAPLGRQVDLIVSAMAMHHVDDTGRLLRTLYDHLLPGGRLALADLDCEIGDFHPVGVEGVFHHGFDRSALRDGLRFAGFAEIQIETACTVSREGRTYSVFLATAVRA
jgi:SAM-dependent methyltransferase